MATVSTKGAMLVVLLSVGTVVAIRSAINLQDILDDADQEEEEKVVGSTALPEDAMVKNEEYVALRQRRAEIYHRKSEHFSSQPSRLEGEYYWLKAEDETVIERCCCPKDTTTGMKKNGMHCKFLHAYRDYLQQFNYAEHFLGLKQSSNPTKWNEWVCPGTTGMPEGLGLHHPEDEDLDSIAECAAVKDKYEQDQEDWQETEDDLDAELTAVDGELRDLVSGLWGCHMVLTGKKKVSGTYCGAGALTNVHNCAKKKGRCYTTACYTCDKLPEDTIFSKRKGEGMVVDEVTKEKYISTSGAVKAHALEQCRAACTA